MQQNSEQEQKLSFGPYILIVVGSILILSLITWVVFQNTSAAQSSSPFGIRDGKNTEVPVPDIPRVSLAEAKQVYDSGSAIFVDVRSLGSYNTSHIKGAINIPLNEIGKSYNQLGSARWIIPYCT